MSDCKRLVNFAILILLNLMAIFLPRMYIYANDTVIHVAPNGTDDSFCGVSEHPCRTLQHALGKLTSGGTIKIAQGTYTASAGAQAVLDLTLGSDQVGKDVVFTLIGGYLPPNWDVPSSDPSLTVLDGQNVHRVINIISVPKIRVHIRGITIQNGLVNVPSHPDGFFSGGGLYCLNDHPYDTSAFVTVELVNVVFRNNRVEGYGIAPASGGGASFYRRCRGFLEHVVFEDNEVKGGGAVDGTRGAHALGGGLFAATRSDVDARDVIFRRNKVQAGSGGRGYKDHEWDRADGLGGGAAFQHNWVRLQNIVVEGNIARAGSGSDYGGFGAGGGLFFEYSTGTIVDGEIKANEVWGGSASNGRGGEASGGGIMATDSQLTLSELMVIENKEIGGNGIYAGHAGGALYFTKASSSSIMKVSGVNLILAFNRAEAGSGQDRWGGGGGIFAQDADVVINHATIISNSVLSTMVAPAVIALHNFEKSYVRISNSIIAFHPSCAFPTAAIVSQRAGDEITLENVVFWQNAGGDTSIWYSGAYLTVTNSINGDPKLSADFHLQKGSVAIDRASSPIATDFEGDPRPFGEAPDIGADEYMPIYLMGVPLDKALRLYWKINLNLVPGVNSYGIEACKEGTQECVTIYVDNQTSTYLLSGLTNYQRYRVRVDALDVSGGRIESSNVIVLFPTDRVIYLPLVTRGTR